MTPDEEFDLKAAKHFLRALDPNAESFTFQIFPEREEKVYTGYAPGDVVPKGVKPKINKTGPEARILNGSIADLGAKLASLNSEGAGIFVTVNETDGKGRKASNITRIRAVFADCDSGLPERKWPVPPSCVVESSPGKFHVYWFIDDEDAAMTVEEFAGIQARLVLDYKADQNAKDVARVLRLPGSINNKPKARGHRVRISAPKRGEDINIYTVAALVEAFPAPKAPKRIERKGSKLSRPSDMQDVLSALEFLADMEYGAHPQTGVVETWCDSQLGWTLVALALWREFGDDAFEHFDAWSQGSDKYDEAAVRWRWATLKSYEARGEGKDFTVRSIFHAAQSAGWQNPKKRLPATVERSGEDGTVERIGIEFREKNAQGRPDKESLANIRQFLECSGVTLFYDEFSRKPYMQRGNDVRVLDDAAHSKLRMAMHECGLRVSREFSFEVLSHDAKKMTVHPVRDYLDGLEWDRKSRVDTWFSTYAGAEDTPLHRAFGRGFLVAAVRRIRHPGTKVRMIPVLEGAQNIGKSDLWRALAVRPEWFTDQLEIGADAKTLLEKSSGKWIVEIPDLSGMSRSDVNAVKASISATHDMARLAYDRTVTEIARQYVLASNTNDRQYLRDKSGNTRFWPVPVSKLRVDRLARDVDQLWAEAAVIEAKGEPFWLVDTKLISELELINEAREVSSELEQTLLDIFGATDGKVFIASADLWEAAGIDRPAKARATKAQQDDLSSAAKKRGWVSDLKRVNGKAVRGWRPRDVESAAVTSLSRFDERNGKFVPLEARTSEQWRQANTRPLRH